MNKFARLLPFIIGMTMANEGKISEEDEEEGGNMGEHSICLECKYFDITEKVKNCYIENSFEVFCKRNKVEAVITKCKDFKKQEPIIIEEEAQAEEQILTQTKAEAEKEMTKQADKAEVQQELEEKGGVL